MTYSMDSLAIIAVFLLGASLGFLITTIRFRSETTQLKAELERLPKQGSHTSKEAA
jgi:hypothetical protein